MGQQLQGMQGIPGMGGAGMQGKGPFPEDAFRHFRNDNGYWNGQQPPPYPPPQGYNWNGPPPGPPGPRESPMHDGDAFRHFRDEYGSWQQPSRDRDMYRRDEDMYRRDSEDRYRHDRGTSPPRRDHRQMSREYGSPDRPAPMKAEASTMTSFQPRDEPAPKSPSKSVAGGRSGHHIEAYTSLNTYDKLGALGLNTGALGLNTGGPGGYAGGGTEKKPDIGVPREIGVGLSTADQLRPPQGAPVAPLQETALLPPPSHVADELKAREAWVVGSIIEVYSASAGRWYVAQICQVSDSKVGTSQMLTVQFMGDNMQFLQKTMPRSDVQVAPFGRNTKLMPPDFQKVASESRPGQFSYQDTTTGVKYQTKELAWQNYFIKALKAATNKAEAVAKKDIALAPDAPSCLLNSDLYAGARGPDPVLAQSLLPDDKVFTGGGAARSGAYPQNSQQYSKSGAAPGYNAGLAGTGEQPVSYGSAAAGTGAAHGSRGVMETIQPPGGGDRSRSLTRADASSRARTQSVNRAELMQNAQLVAQAGTAAHARPPAASAAGLSSPAKTVHDISSLPVAGSPYAQSSQATPAHCHTVTETASNLPPPTRQSFAGLKPSTLPPGYGVSFAVGADAGCPAYLLNGGAKAS